MKNQLLLFLFMSSVVITGLNITTDNFFSGMENEPTYTHLSELPAEERKEAIKHFIETGACEYKGIKLYGKVEFVTSFPDIKIEYVTSFPDINVKFVNSFANDCGEWKEVSSFPDFKVQVVTSFPDLKVKKVTSFPGMD